MNKSGEVSAKNGHEDFVFVSDLLEDTADLLVESFVHFLIHFVGVSMRQVS